MAAPSDLPRVQRMLAVAAGTALIGSTFAVNTVLDGPGTSTVCGYALVVTGCLFLVLGFALARRRVGHVLAKGSLAVLSAIATIAFAELTFRVIGYDFDSPSPDVPICVCRPSFHDGGGILRRRGPAVWRGKPLSWLVRDYPRLANAYPEEQTIEARYDQFGFRNPSDLTDWEVVVTGDSFVESGYLGLQDIFTSVAARQLGVRFKNLGVSGTGPVFQTAYVEKYGKALSTKHAVLCFFDGNDVSDLYREVEITNAFSRTGRCLGAESQPSLIVALQKRFGRSAHPRTAASHETTPNAVLTVGSREFPLLILSRPPNWEDLTTMRHTLVATALTNWSRTVRSRGMQPWVMSIPERQRVFDGYLRYLNTNSLLAHSRPRPFGPALSNICTQVGIRFIDTRPALRLEMEMGRVPYNLHGDAHLNVNGSRTVGNVLAEALRPYLMRPREPSNNVPINAHL